MYIRVNDLDARVQRIERVLTNQSLLELAQRIDALQADLRTIRGEVELLQNETQGGKTQSRNLYGDLEKRLAALETLGGVGAAARRRRAAGARAARSEQATYDAGMAALRGGSYDKAIASFREVVTNYPAGDLASNAQFWIGESYYTKGDLESAVTAYRKVLADWPDSRKAPDAHGEARLLAVGPEAHRRGAQHARRSGPQVSGDARRAARRGSPQAPRKMTGR